LTTHALFGWGLMPETPKTTMTITKEQSEQMLQAAKPLIQWINENCHPHTKITVDQTSVELMEGVATNRTEEFLKD
jgi:hypothetical protein